MMVLKRYLSAQLASRFIAMALATCLFGVRAVGSQSLPPTPTATRLPMFASDGQLTVAAKTLTSSTFTGKYEIGGELGHSMSLVLRVDGHFECTFYARGHVQGTASGIWKLEKDMLALTKKKSSGALIKYPLAYLHIVLFQDHVLLVEPHFAKSFKETGPSASICFHTREAGESIDRWEQENRGRDNRTR